MRFSLIAATLLTLAPALPAFAQPLMGRDLVAHGPQSYSVSLSQTPKAPSTVLALVDKSDQHLKVFVNGRQRYTWPVSTARRGKITPNGEYTAYLLSRYHKSSLYNDAPMPYSIFFHSHYAIHGTDQVSRLGRPASAGCVRLHPDHASVLFDLTKQVGLENMKVVIRD
ncbi:MULTISPECIES: L,D-transpeptidase [Shimia]|uniref:L,D-transpeptidase n=1 Tax=Shimia TaxID=573139 RepID=UPI001FB21398|nr:MULTISPECIES: L,D-transpeptidase [Shimia]MDV4145148.1 L,D-transpeptidase [Shimia sp. FJ5]